MTIKNDRQSKTNNLSGAVETAIDAIDQIVAEDGPITDAELAELEIALAKDEAHAAQASKFIPNPALVEAARKNREWHEHLKANGFKTKRNAAIDAHRQSPEGKRDRNEAERIAYAERRADQGDVVRDYQHLAGWTEDQKAERVRDQNAESQRNRRKNLTDDDREELRRKDRERKRLARAAQKS